MATRQPSVVVSFQRGIASSRQASAVTGYQRGLATIRSPGATIGFQRGLPNVRRPSTATSLQRSYFLVPSSVIGPAFEAISFTAPTTAVGPKFNFYVGKVITDVAGPPFWDTVVTVPQTSFGSIFDHLISIGSVPSSSLGPGFHSTSSAGGRFGPSSSISISVIPQPISVLDPNTISVPVVRNRLSIESVDFKSPGVYKTELDPETGKATGFKV